MVSSLSPSSKVTNLPEKLPEIYYKAGVVDALITLLRDLSEETVRKDISIALARISKNHGILFLCAWIID